MGRAPGIQDVCGRSHNPTIFDVSEIESCYNYDIYLNFTPLSLFLFQELAPLDVFVSVAIVFPKNTVP